MESARRALATLAALFLNPGRARRAEAPVALPAAPEFAGSGIGDDHLEAAIRRFGPKPAQFHHGQDQKEGSLLVRLQTGCVRQARWF